MQIQASERLAQPQRFMEHRWGKRVTLYVPVYLATPAGAGVPAVLRDASISGGFLETDLGLPVYAKVSVVLLVGTGSARRAVEVPACVTRIAADGVGVEWREMASPPILALLRASGADLAWLTQRDRVFS